MKFLQFINESEQYHNGIRNSKNKGSSICCREIITDGQICFQILRIPITIRSRIFSS